MTLLDANILLYAYNADAAQHQQAREWVKNLFSSGDFIGLPWLTILAFIRIGTNPRIFPRPLKPEDAFSLVRTWLARTNVVVVQAGPRHLELLEHLVASGQAAGNLVSDAALAALAIEQGADLASTDRDFSRFPGLRWIDPLA